MSSVRPGKPVGGASELEEKSSSGVRAFFQESPESLPVPSKPVGKEVEDDLVWRTSLKKPEFKFPTQGNHDVLEYYADFMHVLDDVELEAVDQRLLFKSGLNSETKEIIMTGDLKRASVAEQVRFVCQMLEIGQSTILAERDRLYQREGESPLQFLVRWRKCLRKAEVLNLPLVEISSSMLFVSRLRQHQTLMVLMAPLEDDLVKMAMKATPIQRMLRRDDPRPKREFNTRKHVEEKRESLRPKDTKREEKRTCHLCGKVGHLRANCPSASQKRNQAQTSVSKWSGKLEGKPVSVLLDSCADVSCVSDQLTFNTSQWYPSRAATFFWGKTKVRPDRELHAKVELEGREHLIVLQEVEQQLLGADVLLSREDAARFGYAMSRISEEISEYSEENNTEMELDDITSRDLAMEVGEITDLSQLFKKIRVDDKELEPVVKQIPFAASVKDLKEPCRIDPVVLNWRADMPASIISQPFKQAPEAEKYLEIRAKELIEAGIMSRGNSSYASPWFAVPKKEPGEFREVIDLRKINEFQVPSADPVNTVESLLLGLGSKKFVRFGELDLKLAFWQIPVSEQDARKQAVRTRKGLLLFNRLAMGGIDSSTILEKIVREKFVDAYNSLGREGWMGVYRDNLYYGCLDIVEEKFILDFIGRLASELNLKFGSGRVGARDLSILGFQMSAEAIKPVRKTLRKFSSSNS